MSGTTAMRDGESAEPVTRMIDAEGERLVISNMLARAEFCQTALPQLTLEDFALDQHRRVFQLLSRAIERGHEPGLSGAYRLLLDLGQSPHDIGLPLLSSLAWDNSVELANPAAWIGALKRKSAERKAWRVAEHLRTDIETGEAVSEQIAAASEQLRKLQGELLLKPSSAGTIAESLSAIGIDALLAEPQGVIPSPWPKLTDLLNGGPRPGELWIVAARPSVGKTTAVLQWALHAAAEGLRAQFFSLEMPVADLLKRMLSAEGAIPHGLLVRGNLAKDWRLRVAQTVDRIGDYPLEVDDKCRDLRNIVGKIAAAAEGRKPSLVVVDYLGLVEIEGRFENRNAEVSTISRQLKMAAMDYGVPIVCAHQLSRANETANRRPQLSDLRDSGSLEQDADVVLLLDAPASRKQDTPKEAVDVIIAKQRNGPRGHVVNLQMESRFCKFIEMEASSRTEAA